MKGMTKIKMCGMSRMADITAANDIGPDYIGFVFFKRSKRYVSPDQAALLKKELKSGIKAVGVFVNEDIDAVARMANEDTIDVIQLHGSEDDKYIKDLRERTDKPIIQAFIIREEQDIKKAEKSPADMILLDAGAGSGEAFDWNMLNDIKRPYFLAGGLSYDNVKGAVMRLHPYAVDVSSGIETDGKKDEKKMRHFFEEVKNVG